MIKSTLPKHYIKEWRQHKGLSLRRLAARLETPDGSEVISYSSLSRIEKGVQPYSQPILEALAQALGTDPASLIMRDPTKDDAIWNIWEQIPVPRRSHALDVLKTFRKTGS